MCASIKAKISTIAGWVGLIICLATPSGFASEMALRSAGQTVYVPIYSHIYAGDREQPIYLAATLSIRNTDPRASITLVEVDYYDSEGQLLQHYLKTPLILKQRSSTRYVISESDKLGGSGAHFIVQWVSDRPVNAPLIESIMISAKSQLGISFTSRGQVVGP